MQGVRIISCAVVVLVDEAALQAALDSGHVAGASFDVFVEGKPPRTSCSVARRRLRPIGASTSEAQENISATGPPTLSDLPLTRAVTTCALNIPAVSAEEARRNVPPSGSPNSSAPSPVS